LPGFIQLKPSTKQSQSTLIQSMSLIVHVLLDP